MKINNYTGNLAWICLPFQQLTVEQLYTILRLRNRVFVVEQNCVYEDTDNKDQEAYHLMAWHDGKLLAYTRLFKPGDFYDAASIGRVLTAPEVRGTQMGKELMQRSIQQVYALWGPVPIHISAQLYLKKFYSAFGFQPVSDVYLEDGIEHIAMEKMTIAIP